MHLVTSIIVPHCTCVWKIITLPIPILGGVNRNYNFTLEPSFIIATIKSMSNHLLGAPVCKLPMNVPVTITE